MVKGYGLRVMDYGLWVDLDVPTLKPQSSSNILFLLTIFYLLFHCFYNRSQYL